MRHGLVVCLFGVLTVATSTRAQTAESSEPTAAQIEAARRALQAERTALRLASSDAWMKHLFDEERRALTIQRWLAVGTFGFSAVIWGAGAGINEVEHGPRTHSLLLGGASALSLGLGLATMLVDPDETAITIGRWGVATEFAMGSVASVLVASSSDCNVDCPRVLTATTFVFLMQALAVAIAGSIQPHTFVSDHYDSYRALSPEARAERGLELMLQREQRIQIANYLNYAFAVGSASAYAFAAAVSEREGTRLGLGIAAAATLLTSSVNLIVKLLERTPSERLVAGVPPVSD